MVDNIKVFTHSSIRVQSGDKVIYADPFEIKQAPHDADIILITHDHYDHFSTNDISRIAKPGTVLVVPDNMAKKAEDARQYVGRIETIAQGSSKEVDGLTIETIPAYNTLKPFHMKSAGWVGYIFEADGKRVYIAGDTDATKEAKAVKCDIALVPIGGHYTMDCKDAAAVVNTIKPEVAIPTHYGSIVGSPEDGKRFAELVDDSIKVEIKIGND